MICHLLKGFQVNCYQSYGNLISLKKWDFFHTEAVLVLLYGCTAWILLEKVCWELHKNATCRFKQILEAAPHRIAAVCLWCCIHVYIIHIMHYIYIKWLLHLPHTYTQTHRQTHTHTHTHTHTYIYVVISTYLFKFSQLMSAKG